MELVDQNYPPSNFLLPLHKDITMHLLKHWRRNGLAFALCIFHLCLGSVSGRGYLTLADSLGTCCSPHFSADWREISVNVPINELRYSGSGNLNYVLTFPSCIDCNPMDVLIRTKIHSSIWTFLWERKKKMSISLVKNLILLFVPIHPWDKILMVCTRMGKCMA